MLAIGLMSGTSMDGIDAAILRSDGERIEWSGPALTLPYEDGFRTRLRGILGGRGDVAGVERALTDLHAQAVRALLKTADIAPGEVDVIGFHGHTILHRPEEGRTWQIGDGARLAQDLGIAVVCDMRSADVAAGGQGAPLVPVYHAALCAALPKPVAVVNIGGVANVTWIGESDLLAFDTGPGNAPLDDWALRHTGKSVDTGGALARKGRADAARLADLLRHEYFAAQPPKSLDRDDFRSLADAALAGLGAKDGAALLTAFTAQSIAESARHFPAPPKLWLVCGGGRHNPVLMEELRQRLGGEVRSVDELGWDGDAVEAQAFAFLAIRSLRGLPNSFPTTTGCDRPVSGGRLHRPPKAA